MGWFNRTPKWYDIVMKSSQKAEAFRLDNISINKLEELRMRMGLDDDNFAFLYMGCNTVTARMQRIIYSNIKHNAPPGTPEKDILNQLLASRLNSIKPHVDRDTYLIWEREFRVASEQINTIDDAVKFICSLSEKTDFFPVTSVRREIDMVLGGSL